jgi:RND family efflux transporter MFP subunit
MNLVRVVALAAPWWLWVGGCGGDAAATPELTPLEGGAAVDDVRVETAVLEASSAKVTLDLPGEIAGSHDVVLASALGGLVERVEVAEGDRVQKGQTLAVIDREPRAAQVDQGAAQLKLAESELARLQQMGDLATASQLDGLTAQVEIAKAQLRLARNQLDRTVIRSPIDGVVASLDLDAGEVAAPGAPAIRVVQLDPVLVTLSVSDRDVVALERGLAARVTTPSAARQHDGLIKNIGAAADLSTRSFLVEVEVANPDGKLLPGMIAKVAVERTIGEGKVVLPQPWIVTRTEGYGVFVVEPGETAVARWRPVKLGQVAHDQVVVEEGVSAGDEVVMVGQHGLVDGDHVLVTRKGRCCTDGRAVYGEGQ